MRSSRYDWMDKAECTPEDDALFFVAEFEHASPRRFDEAKKICGRCPVKLKCEEYRRDLKPRPSEGVWAGRAYLPRGKVQPPRDEEAPEM